ncbi:MAG: fibronectin type III domain-containing protein, partial [Anaerolineales bacterium]|nr:fibronectin type III domain-containing protein [Anaerolineales bacterium]
TAYKLLTTHLQGIQPLWRSRPGGEDPYNGPQELIAFYQPSAGKRVIGMWARDNRPQTAVITATATSALLIHTDGTQQTITPQDGVYRINLPGATNQNAFWDPNLYMIGGDTRLLIEDFDPSQVDNTPPTVSAWGRVRNEAKTEIELTWQGSDPGGSGIRHYNVAVQVEGGTEQAWLTETTETTAVYASEPGKLYTFWVTAVDNAGNRSTPRRVLVLTLDLPVRGYFPIVIQN